MLLFCFLAQTKVIAQIKGNTITEKGAWCWFADPRAISYENESGTINSTYIGYIDIHGNIKATQINHLTQTTSEVLIRSYFQPDDHNNPTFLVLPDERIMIFYSRHTDEACFYYRISQKPGDITSLGKEFRLETINNTTYPSPFILSDDPEHIYLCWRGIGWHPTIARLTMPDENDNMKFDWGPFQILRSLKGGSGVRPYAKYASNGKDKIHLTYTTTHPDNKPVNHVYYSYIDINTKALKDIKGNTLSEIGNGNLHDIDATDEYKNSHPYAVVDDAPYRDWVWEITTDEKENPVIAMVRISENKESHDYYYARWNGKEWQKTFLSNAGGHFHQTPGLEKCYSGGMAIDKTNPNVIYASVPVSGIYKNVYELMKYTIAPDGTLASTEQLTFDSPRNNVRPFVISSKENNLKLIWMNGDYYDWIVSAPRPLGFSTAIRTNMNLPLGSINLGNGLLSEHRIGSVSPEKTKTIRVPKSKTFSVVMNLSIDHDAYYGDILKTNAFTYSLKQDERPKPYIQIKNQLYESTNILGNSDAWSTNNRGTGGQWYTPTKLNTFQLAISYENGILKTYINGLVDQYIELNDLSLSELTMGGCKSIINDIKVYNRALSQSEMRKLIEESSYTNKGDIINIIHKTNQYWQSTHPQPANAFWHPAAYHTGNMAAYEATKAPAYLNYSKAWAEKNEWKGAKSDDKAAWKYSYGERNEYVLFGDWQICFQTYIDLYLIEPDEKKIARAIEVMEYQMSTPNNDYWWWVDGLYMVMPVMTKLHKVTGNPLYLEKLHDYFTYAKNLMHDEESNLFYRDAKYIYPKHQTKTGKKDFWARGNGWLFAGLAKTLQDLPLTDPHRDEYIQLYQSMAKTLKASQQPEGHWTRSIFDPEQAPGYETSGTAFFTYGFLWGMNNGLLENETYKDVVDKSWKYLTKIALQPNGKVGYVQPIGERADQHKNVGPETTADFGVGAFLLAASEMLKYINDLK